MNGRSPLIIDPMAPRAPRPLAPVLTPAARHLNDTGRIPAIFAGMRCDGVIGCKEPPTITPIVFIPSWTPLEDGHRDISMFTDLHYCAAHLGALKLDEMLTDKVKANIEAHARRARPHGFRPHFEAAHLTYTDVASPAYQAWMAKQELSRG